MLHAVADRLTGYQGLRPLDHFTDDAGVLAFTRGPTRSARNEGDTVTEVGRLTEIPALLPDAPVRDPSRTATWASALDRFAGTVGREVAWAVTGSALHGVRWSRATSTSSRTAGARGDP
ncbi:hypothetical protein ACFFMR_25940 [Micromonospora andamanensis]|uniref:Uncharacterized protein n=1 Tax=Micromonospora andamanensis TaxID=1287068 RepID=A0ABQ4I5L9_9ACTN|nr:hypothetical protein [Micromonospora andamanensis]GIJ13196.1 hypothetical protein Van01_64100 [Micromonospora andamanensis]